MTRAEFEALVVGSFIENSAGQRFAVVSKLGTKLGLVEATEVDFSDVSRGGKPVHDEFEVAQVRLQQG